MTKIQKLIGVLKTSKSRSVTQMTRGKAQKEIQGWNLSVESKRSAYREVLRASGYDATMEAHVHLLAESAIK